MSICICSFILAISVCILESFALLISPFYPVSKFILTPANIKRIIIVTTRATNVIPFVPLISFIFRTPPFKLLLFVSYHNTICVSMTFKKLCN